MCACVCVYVCDCVCHLSFSRFCVRVCGRLCACYRAFYTCVRLSNLACVALLLLWSLSCCLARLYVSLGSTSSVSSRLPSTLFSALFQTIRRIPFIVHILFPLHSTLHPFACTRTHTHTHKHTHARFPPPFMPPLRVVGDSPSLIWHDEHGLLPLQKARRVVSSVDSRSPLLLLLANAEYDTKTPRQHSRFLGRARCCLQRDEKVRKGSEKQQEEERAEGIC